MPREHRDRKVSPEPRACRVRRARPEYRGRRESTVYKVARVLKDRRVLRGHRDSRGRPATPALKVPRE